MPKATAWKISFAIIPNPNLSTRLDCPLHSDGLNQKIGTQIRVGQVKAEVSSLKAGTKVLCEWSGVYGFKPEVCLPCSKGAAQLRSERRWYMADARLEDREAPGHFALSTMISRTQV